MMAAGDLVLAMTGASGAPYGLRLLEVLLRAGRTVHLTLSPAAAEVLEQECDRRVQLDHFALADLLGAVVLPASPAFYTRPRSLDDAIDFIVGRICDQLGVEHQLLRRWGDAAGDPGSSGK